MACLKVRRKQCRISIDRVKRLYTLESLLLFLVAPTTFALTTDGTPFHIENPDVIVFANVSTADINLPIMNTTDFAETEISEFTTTITTSAITIVHATESNVALNTTNTITTYASNNTTVSSISNSTRNANSSGNHSTNITSDSVIPTNATKPTTNGNTTNDTSTNKRNDTSPDKRNDTFIDQKNETFIDQKNETFIEQKNDTYIDQKNDTYIDQKNDTSPEKKNDTFNDKGNDTFIDQKNDTFIDQKNETFIDQKNETFIDKKNDNIIDKKDDTIIDKKNDTIIDKKNDTSTQKKTDTSTHNTSYATIAAETTTIATPMPTPGPWYPDAPYPLAACQHLVASKAPPMANVTWLDSAEDASSWAAFNGTSSRGRRLESALRFYALATVEETPEWTALCVGASHLASHSYEDGGSTPAVSVEVQPRWDVAVGIVRLRSRCWRRLERLSKLCSPSFTPLQYFSNLPLFHYSPLEEILWILFFGDSMGMNLWGIHSVNITTFQGSIPSNWIYKMNLPFLEYFHITGNDWKETSVILRNLPRLIHLNLSDNNLIFLPEDFFSNMTNLEAVILDHNDICKCPSSINQLRNLSVLNLSHKKGNSILKLGGDDFENLPKSLKMLELSHTKLEINLGEVLLLPELCYLNISGCDINIINKQISVDPGRLLILDISSNHLIAVSSDYFSEMSSMEILIMDKNNFYLIPDLPIENILTPLYVAHNFSIFLTQNTTVHLQKLEILDLSWCMIEQIFEPLFNNAYSLKQVDLSHNLLRYVPSCLFCLLYNLEEVDLSYNYIQTVYLWKWNLKTLNFSSNGIVDFSVNTSAIEHLDLSFNIIQNVDLVSSSVQNLNFSYNSISYISPELWENMSKTLKVDLGGNDFVCCLFKDACYLNKKQDTEIQNLGTFEPLQCSINAKSSQISFSTFTYDTYCSTRETILLSVIVITCVAVLMFAAIFAAFTFHVLQRRQRKLTIQHPANSRETNT